MQGTGWELGGGASCKHDSLSRLVRQRAEAIKAFDEKLAMLGLETIPTAPITENAYFKSLI